MKHSTRLLRIVLGIITVWCLGCDAFEAFLERANTSVGAAESLSPSRNAATGASAVDQGGEHACHCVQGHGAQVVTLQPVVPVSMSPNPHLSLARTLTALTQPPPVPPPIG